VRRLAVIVGLATALVAGPKHENQIAARHDAAAHLAALALPSGAVRSAREPAGDNGRLVGPFSEPATPNLVDAHAWWVLSESPASVLQYVEDHPPPGAQPSLARTISGGGKPSLTGVGFAWPALPGRLSGRSLLVEVVRLANGSTGLRADGQAVWITPRPASERIPAGARRLVLSTWRAGRRVQGPRTVTAAAPIRRVVRLLNGLPAEQPGAYSCPADFGSQIRLIFYGGAGPTPLAAAHVDPGGCGLVSLTIRGRSQPALAGGGLTLVRRLSHALGFKIDAGIPTR
jgi:hypothetical protein